MPWKNDGFAAPDKHHCRFCTKRPPASDNKVVSGRLPPYRVAVLAGLSAAFVWLAVAAPASADLNQRLVEWFHFEERALGNFEKMPRYWFAVGRDPQVGDATFLRQPLHRQLVEQIGHPAFNEVRFDTRYATSGDTAFYLGLSGGNTAAFLQNGAIAVVPDSDYLITAKVRTEALERAGVCLSAYFIDRQGQKIEASVIHSPKVRSNDKWTPVSIKLVGQHTQADYLGIQLEVVQPGPDQQNPLGREQVILQDIGGGAWFDDIAIWQLPHVEVRTQNTVNVVRAPRRPQMSMNVRDLSGQRLYAEMTVYDIELNRIAHERRGVGGGQPSRWGWTPRLPGYGWYLVDMTVHARPGYDDPPLARSLGAVLWMPDEGPMKLAEAPTGQFALIAERMTGSQLEILPALLEACRLDQVVLSGWSRDTTLRDLAQRQDALDELAFTIRNRGGSVVMSLSPVPEALSAAQGIERVEPLAMMQADEATWRPYLAPVLMRHGQRIAHWQIGTAREPYAFYYANLPSLLGHIQKHFRSLAPRPQLVIPWRLDQARRDDVTLSDLTYALDVPVSITPEQLTGQLASWRSPPANFWLYLRPLPANEVSHLDRAADLALRMLYGWEGGAAGLAIDKPWIITGNEGQALLPDPMLGVFSNVAARLTDRRVVGRLPIGEGMRGMVLDGAAGGAIVAWRTSADEHDAVIDMNLGNEPILIDLWGNRSPVSLVNGRHQIPLTSSPVFIEGIDANLALFRAGFAVDRPLIESTQEPHARKLLLTNPWPRTITGELQIIGPKGWIASPSRHTFSIGAGQRLELPVTLRFPVSEVAGQKELVARFSFTADRQYQVDIETPLELGLEDVSFQATLAVEPSRDPATPDALEAVVVALVTNTGGEPKSLFVFANLPQRPRQEVPISQLEPGQTVLRTFRFPDAGRLIRDFAIRAGVRQTNGPAMLNTRLNLSDIQP